MRCLARARKAAPPAGLLVALALASPASLAARLEVEVHLEPQVMGLDEMAELWIEVRSNGLSRVGFEPDFRLENLEPLGPPTTAQNLLFLNGVSTRTLRYTWRLRPLDLGPAAVRSIWVEIDGERIDLPSQTLDVVRDPPARRRGGLGAPPPAWDPFQPPDATPQGEARRQRGTPKVFLQAELSPPRPYVGQQALYTLWLYTQGDISEIHPRDLPSFQGFWAREVPPPKVLKAQMVEARGESYGRVPLLRRALYARRPGTFEIEAALYELTVRPNNQRLFGPARVRPRRVAEHSQALKVRVRPLPDGPPSFAGAVGDLELETHLEPSEVATGESATLTVTLRGDGHIQSLPALQVDTLEGLRVLPPQETSDEDLTHGRLEGRRTWTFVLVPEEAGTFEIPRFEVPFFDPAVEAYRVATSPPLALRSHPGNAPHRQDFRGELHPIRSAAVPIETHLRWQRWLPALFALPMALALGAQVLRHRRRRTALRPAELRLLARLEDRSAQATTPRREALRLEEAWRDYLVERWWLPHDTALPRWPEHLSGFAGEVAAEHLGALLADLDYLRQAPQLSTIDALHLEILERSRDLAKRLAALAALEPREPARAQGDTAPP